MMNSRCCGSQADVGRRPARFRRALWVGIGINAAMFGIEMIAGQLAGSQALKADALDFAADTAT